MDKNGHAQQNLQNHEQGCPAWNDVAYRVTADARSGGIIHIEDAANINRDEDTDGLKKVRVIW